VKMTELRLAANASLPLAATKENSARFKSRTVVVQEVDVPKL
jgi:hypothetical protein